jgi:hypothetical protein
MQDNFPDDTDEIRSLTAEQAEHFAQLYGDLSLNGVTTLSDAAAEALSHHKGGHLSLNGLTAISDSAAAALARHEGEVYADSLAVLTSPELAAKLASSDALDNVTSLSAEAAKAIVQSLVKANTDDLYLVRLRSLSADTARELAQFRGSLCLYALPSLSDDAAEELAAHDGGSLELSGVQSLSDLAIGSLARHKGALCLDGLTCLSVEAARSLASLNHDLGLRGVTFLSDQAAKALGRHSADLFLVDLTSLSAEAAEGLAAHDGALYLSGLKSLSTAAARNLASHKELLHLDGLETLADDTARALAKHKGGLMLDGLTTVSDAALQALSRYQGWILSLNSLPALSVKAAAALSGCKADPEYIGGLSLGGLTTISADIAQALGRHEGRLFLGGLVELSDIAAQHLAKHKGLLSMNALVKLSERAAEELARVADIDVDLSQWPESTAACFSENHDRHTTQGTPRTHVSRHALPDECCAGSTDEAAVRSTLILRDLITAAPSVLEPTGHYRIVLCNGEPMGRDAFLRDSCVPNDLRSDVQWTVGDWIASLPVSDSPPFASQGNAPDDPRAKRIQLKLKEVATSVALDAVSADLLRRLYDAAAPATFGDMKTMETRVDPLVRSGREISSDGFSVSPALCDWVARTWASRFQPESVCVKPYKINLYAPGDRFTMHRDTPENNLVGTFLLALSGWGEPCAGGGLTVHDEVGCFRWHGAGGWAAFVPYLPHEVEPVMSGARVTLAFKVFAADETKAAGQSQCDEALLEEVANRIALCRNQRGQVGVLLKYAYSLNGTALCGADRLIYRALERLGTVESVPVAVHIEAEANDENTYYWRAIANVYALTDESLTKIARGTDETAETSAKALGDIPFIPASRGHVIYSNGRGSIERTGNYAEPANISTLYVHRALIVTRPTDAVATPIRCADADLARTDLSDRDLRVADLQGANLSGASLTRANLQRAFLASADLSNANLQSADLSGADLAFADLSQSQLSGTCFRDTSLHEARLDGAAWDAGTVWPEGFDPLQHGAEPMRPQ